MKTDFHLSDGQLTEYSLCCGYIQDIWKNNVKIELYHEHSVYHVRGYNYNNYKRLEWLSFDKLSEARLAFFRMVKLHFDYTKKETLDIIKESVATNHNVISEDY